MDAFVLAPAYEGFIQNSFVLAVSAPSLIDKLSFEKTDLIIDLLHEKLPLDQRLQIDRVRVYESVEDLKIHAQLGFDDDAYERPLSRHTELVQV